MSENTDCRVPHKAYESFIFMHYVNLRTQSRICLMFFGEVVNFIDYHSVA